MSTIAPAPPTPSIAENAAEPPPPRRRWLDRAGVRTIVGLAVLVAIIGGLLAVDRWVLSTDLGPLDARSNVLLVTALHEKAARGEGCGGCELRSRERHAGTIITRRGPSWGWVSWARAPPLWPRAA